MNERIRELKHLAEVWCFENIPEQFSEETGYGEAWEDKFAELIVKECRNLLADEYRNSPAETIGCFIRADEVIAKHFYGIKE